MASSMLCNPINVCLSFSVVLFQCVYLLNEISFLFSIHTIFVFSKGYWIFSNRILKWAVWKKFSLKTVKHMQLRLPRGETQENQLHSVLLSSNWPLMVGLWGSVQSQSGRVHWVNHGSLEWALSSVSGNHSSAPPRHYSNLDPPHHGPENLPLLVVPSACASLQPPTLPKRSQFPFS